MKKLIRKILKEYITREEIYLKDYLSMSDEAKKSSLPHEYYYFFDNFLDEMDYDFTKPKEKVASNYIDEPDEEVDMFEYNLELMTWLENNDKETFNAFADYLFDKIESNTLPINDADYPAWSYFDNDAKIVKNQWLIHFTNNADGIASYGFKYGVDDMTKLGLTTSLGEYDKKYGGYNFAYTLYDFDRYGNARWNGYKYGNEAVIFRASGIKVWHYGDEEPQVIFYGNTAKNIIPITDGENNKWSVRDIKTNAVLYENDKLDKVVEWIVINYDQYRKRLHK